MSHRNGGAPLRDRSAGIFWACVGRAALLVGCASGSDKGAAPGDGLPYLSLDAGSTLTAKCDNLECNRAVCSGGEHTTISGTVFDPAGRTPLYNAIVYVPNAELDPFGPQVTCDRCGGITSGHPISIGLSNAEGRFLLKDVPSGENVPLVIQIGRWRREVFLPHVDPCVDNAVPYSETHLPRNQGEGDIPRFAIVTGAFDPLECLMRKIGIDDAEFTGGGDTGRVHLFQGYGGGGTPTSQPSINLYGEINNYDAVLLACEGDTYPENKPYEAAIDLVAYLNRGGRVYASHFQYYWFAPAPNGVGLAPFPSVATWAFDTSVSPGLVGHIDTSFPKGLAYYHWLENANALNWAGVLPISEGKFDIAQTTPSVSQSWINTGIPNVELMTFNTPIGARPSEQCGRSVFTDMHVASGDLGGWPFPSGCVTQDLTAQEKALEFMLFDMSSCIQEDMGVPSSPLN